MIEASLNFLGDLHARHGIGLIGLEGDLGCGAASSFYADHAPSWTAHS